VIRLELGLLYQRLIPTGKRSGLQTHIIDGHPTPRLTESDRRRKTCELFWLIRQSIRRWIAMEMTHVAPPHEQLIQHRPGFVVELAGWLNQFLAHLRHASAIAPAKRLMFQISTTQEGSIRLDSPP
jgi:hypothetical protein